MLILGVIIHVQWWKVVSTLYAIYLYFKNNFMQHSDHHTPLVFHQMTICYQKIPFISHNLCGSCRDNWCVVACTLLVRHMALALMC